MQHYPIFADLKGRTVLLAGAGHVAERKAESLLQTGALVHVVAATLNPQFEAWQKAGQITWLGAEFQAACQAGDFVTALAYQDRLYPLHDALFTDASPGPVKYAMARVRAGFPETLRLPMTPAGDASRAAVDAALAHAGLV